MQRDNKKIPQLSLTPDVSDRVAKGALTWTLRRVVSETVREVCAVAVEWGGDGRVGFVALPLSM